MKLIKQGSFRITKLAGKAAAVSGAALLPVAAFATETDGGSAAASTITAGASTVGTVMVAVLGVLAAIKVGKLIRRAL